MPSPELLFCAHSITFRRRQSEILRRGAIWGQEEARGRIPNCSMSGRTGTERKVKRHMSHSEALVMSRVSKACVVVCAAAVGVLLWACPGLWSLRCRSDLGSRPPGKAFKAVFHIPLPKSVDDLKIAGFAALSGKAWLRVHVNDVDALLTELIEFRPLW